MRYNRRVRALKVTCDLGSKSRPTVLVAVVSITETEESTLAPGLFLNHLHSLSLLEEQGDSHRFSRDI